MKNSIVLFAVLLGACTAAKVSSVDRVDRRRAQLEMQSVMDMASSRKIPPVEFEFNSAVLKESSFAILDKVSEILLRYPRLKLIVEGHTDQIGSKEYNEELSFARASSVKTYLARRGVHPDSIRVFGYGYSRPSAEENSNEGRALNRRVEFKITTRDWASVY